VCLSAGYKAKEKDGSEGIVKLDSVDSMDEVSSEGDAGGVSGVEWIDAGVVGRVDIEVVNLKMGVAEAGGVGGFSGCNGRGDGGSGGMESTVAICRSDNRGQSEVFREENIMSCDVAAAVRRQESHTRLKYPTFRTTKQANP